MNLQLFAPLLTYPDVPSPRHVEVLAQWAKTLNAHLDLLIEQVEMPTTASALGNVFVDIPGMRKTVEQRSAQGGDEIENEAASIAGNRSLVIRCSRLRSFPGAFSERAAISARYRDLSLLLHNEDESEAALAEAVLFGSGRPSLLVPRESRAEIPGKVAIAWDGSRVAARALADFLSLDFQQARLIIITVTDEKKLPNNDIAEALVEGLRRRGVAAERTDVRADGRGIATAIQDTALEAGAGMLVMGAYGHSRLRDFLLGGATAGVLRSCRMPILLSH